MCSAQQRVIKHAGFSGFRKFVARKNNRCKLIGNCPYSRTTQYRRPLWASCVRGNFDKLNSIVLIIFD